jgi:hypothetical protein
MPMSRVVQCDSGRREGIGEEEQGSPRWGPETPSGYDPSGELTTSSAGASRTGERRVAAVEG